MKTIFTIFIVFLTISLSAVIYESAHFEDFLYGQTEATEYDNWISHIAEGIAEEGYNLYAPYDRQTNGFGDYIIPTDSLMENWSMVITEYLAGNLEAAEQLITDFEFPYQVVVFNDLTTNQTYYVLRENLHLDYYDDNGTPNQLDDEIGAFRYGWGLYVFNPVSENPVIVNMPHPNDDFVTPAIGYKAFKEWDARFLLISGAGREVKWTEEGSYANSKSLSDPSRNDIHPYTVAYKLFCDNIRALTNQREFAAQIHSYDWNRHENHANCQVSAGYHRSCPNLPIRDLSNLQQDIINYSSHLMIPGNNIGANEPVYLNDYYAVNYGIYDFNYSDNDTTYSVNNQIDLPGYSQNRQMLYTFSGWNRYDVFEPFFHLEMDELPDSYPQEIDFLKWFYGFNQDNDNYNFNEIFTHSLDYYSYWIESMRLALENAIILNDNLQPPIPQDISFSDIGYHYIKINWEPVSCYDFETYEILYSTQPISEGNYTIISREDNYKLASPLTDNQFVASLESNQSYFFQIRAKDYNQNSSDLSNEINVNTSPAFVGGFNAWGGDGEAVLEWTAYQQNENMGFNIYRKDEQGDYFLLDSWESNENLEGSDEVNLQYVYYDENLVNLNLYTYKISVNNSEGYEFFHNEISQCSPNRILSLLTSNTDETVKDTVFFSNNIFASDYIDEFYDRESSLETGDNYILSVFHENYGSAYYFEKETLAYYDAVNEFKNWNLRVKTDLLEQDITISFPETLPENEKLLLENLETDEIIDLTTESMTFTAADSTFTNFKLYWGNLQPEIIINEDENKIYQGNQLFRADWEINYGLLLDYMKISLVNETEEIIIEDNIESDVDSLIWEIPEDLTFHNANLKITAFSEDGEQQNYLSPYKLGIVTQTTSITGNEGWRMITNPWPDNVIEYPEFGDDAEIFLMVHNQHYESTDLLEFGKGYWLHTYDTYSITHNYNIQNLSYSIPITNGWNFLFNPHLCSYGIEDLVFEQGNLQFSLQQMIQMQLITPVLYGYHAEKYQGLTTILPKESFFLYSHINEIDDYRLKFIPYYDAENLHPDDYNWKLKLTVKQNSSNIDEIVLGSARNSTDDFDFFYDLIKPPATPSENDIEIFFHKNDENDSLFLYEYLQQEFKSEFQTEVDEIRLWDFKTKVNFLEPIDFQIEFIEFPPEYNAILEFNNNIVNLNENLNFQLQPDSLGINYGIIEINNGTSELVNENIVIKALSNYPNPFNPETIISFSTTKAIENGKILIFNIKGQKVKTIPINNNLHSKNEGKSKLYEVRWNGTDTNNKQVASGVYLYNLKVDNRSKYYGKMLLLK